MLKATITGIDAKTKEKVSVLLLGLVPRNIELLQEGRPIHIELRDLNSRMRPSEREYANLPDDLEVMIFTGDSEEDMIAQVQEYTGERGLRR